MLRFAQREPTDAGNICTLLPDTTEESGNLLLERAMDIVRQPHLGLCRETLNARKRCLSCGILRDNDVHDLLEVLVDVRRVTVDFLTNGEGTSRDWLLLHDLTEEIGERDVGVGAVREGIGIDRDIGDRTRLEERWFVKFRGRLHRIFIAIGEDGDCSCLKLTGGESWSDIEFNLARGELDILILQKNVLDVLLSRGTIQIEWHKVGVDVVEVFGS